jgi:hypothetical protein
LARRALRVAARVQQLDETGDAELEHLAATAKVYEAAALAALGRWRAANRIFDELAASGRSSTAQALSGLARRSEQTDSTLAEVGGVSMLFLRARALGQGDKRITRIALEESLRDGIGASRRSLLGKVVTRFYLGGRGRDSEP